MRLSERLILLFLVLGLSAAAQAWLFVHVHGADPPTPGTLAAPLETLPLTLGDWQGKEFEVTDEQLLFGDTQSQRMYQNMKTGQQLKLWIVYDQAGEDRGHHPEVCMAVAGQPEDPAARGETAMPGHTAAAQRYRFGRRGSQQWVYYWYYSLPTRETRLDGIQQSYYDLRTRQASVTLEVFAPEQSEATAQEAEEFVRLVDAAFQELLPQGAERGSRRLPVTMVEE